MLTHKKKGPCINLQGFFIEFFYNIWVYCTAGKDGNYIQQFIKIIRSTILIMCKCKKCGKKFGPQKGLTNYCSLKCRNSRVWNDADKLKKSLSRLNSEKVKRNL